MAMSFEQVTKKYRGKMIRLYTRNDTAVMGFLLGNSQDSFITLSPSEPHKCVVYTIPRQQVRCILGASFLEEHGKLCRHLYGSSN